MGVVAIVAMVGSVENDGEHPVVVIPPPSTLRGMVEGGGVCAREVK